MPKKDHHGVRNEFGPITVHNVQRSVVGAKSERRGHQIHQQARCYLQTAPLRSRICILTLYPSRKIEREVESRFINVCGRSLETVHWHDSRSAPCTCVTKALLVRAQTIRDYIIEINCAALGVTSTILVSHVVHRGVEFNGRVAEWSSRSLGRRLRFVCRKTPDSSFGSNLCAL